jgi:hypothetical protein
VDGGTELTTNALVSQNPNFGNARSRLAPLSVRFGARLTF